MNVTGALFILVGLLVLFAAVGVASEALLGGVNEHGLIDAWCYPSEEC